MGVSDMVGVNEIVGLGRGTQPEAHGGMPFPPQFDSQ
jgi:hypothetical protein